MNFVRSRRLAWAEIVRVNFRQGDPWATLDLADGTSLAAVGIQSGVGKAQAIADARRCATWSRATAAEPPSRRTPPPDPAAEPRRRARPAALPRWVRTPGRRPYGYRLRW
ncbi:PH domain-containing protein [Kitasatospora aburaviensis]